MPAALMALARVDRPAVVLSSGPMLAGHAEGRALTIEDVWEAVGAHAQAGGLPDISIVAQPGCSRGCRLVTGG